MRVLKFGGTSVGSAENIKRVAEIVAKESSGDRFVVVSAVGGITNQLEKTCELAVEASNEYESVLAEIEKKHLDITRQVLPAQAQSAVIGQIKYLQNELEDICKGIYLLREITPRSRDYVLSFGERISSLIIYAYFSTKFEEVAFIDPGEWIICDQSFGQGIVDLTASRKASEIARKKLKKINVAPGFIASTPKGETITLGRGGSDYSASLFAHLLRAEELMIWTDVSGLMTADPRWVKKARPIHHLSYEEALELSHFGAKVIYPPTIQPAMEQNIPIKIKNTFQPEKEGTTITRSWEDANVIRGISSISNLVLLNFSGSGMVGIPNISARLFKALADEQVNVIMITQASSEHTICVAVEQKEVKKAVEAIHEAFEYEMKLHRVNAVEVEEDLAVVALVGTNMKNQVGIAGQMFNSLGQNGISIKAIAQGSSERNISVVIHQNDLRKSLNVLHESFFLTEIKKVNLFIIGVGNVGQALLEQVRKQKKYLLEHYHIELEVVTMANSKRMMVDQNGIALDKWTSLLHEASPYTLESYLQQMEDLNLRNSIFVDVTASEEVSDIYAEVLKRSIAVVTPNKLAATSPYQHYQTLKHLSRKFRANFLFETNVCAGLPVISTLNDLMKSGDRIHKIEGVFSGTLNFIFNQYNGDSRFSDIVRMAKNEGYTEPDPRLDLSGEDVKRKILILARESGQKLDIEDVDCQPFVPEKCMKAKDIDAFFRSLDDHEQHFKGLLNEANQQGKSLRYIASFFDGKAKTGLQMIDSSHPFYHLEGKDNIVLFYTDRYRDQPLVVKGAGAGAEVTASGIFADIMKVANANG